MAYVHPEAAFEGVTTCEVGGGVRTTMARGIAAVTDIRTGLEVSQLEQKQEDETKN